MPLTLKIKQVTGQDTFPVEAEADDTVATLKEAVAAKVAAEPAAIRLIYRGQILKDASTLESYGLQNDHVVHMVKSKQPQSGAAGGAAGAVGASSAAAAPSRSTGTDPIAEAMRTLQFGDSSPAGAGGTGGTQADMMQQMLQSPMTQALLNNPELMRTMLNANPQVRQMVEANPEIGRMLNDPATLRQMAQVMSNPALMREQVRNMDRALSNIESMPGGFNALAQFHSSMQPVDDAASEPADAAAAGGDNPFAALFQPAAQPAAGSAQQPAAGAPNEAPLPNPWAAGSGGGAAAGGAAAGLGGLGSLGGLGMGAMDPAQMEQMMNNPEMQAAMQQMLADPTMRQAIEQQMSAVLSTPEGRAQMSAMLETNPMYQSMVAANPAAAAAMRDMMTDPERLRAMMDPRTQHAMQQMAQAMQELQSTGLFPQLPAGLGGSGLGLGGGAGAGLGAGAGASGAPPNMDALLGLLGGGAGGLGFGMPPPPANPEEAYASQLQQLQDMGFYDREANIRALVAAGGNVNVAVERLLSSM